MPPEPMPKYQITRLRFTVGCLLQPRPSRPNALCLMIVFFGLRCVGQCVVVVHGTTGNVPLCGAWKKYQLESAQAPPW